MWDTFCVINCMGWVVIGWSSNPSLKYCIPSCILYYCMCSLNCVHTLLRRLVAYSPSLSYCSQILASKSAKDFSIQFSSAVLYFTNLGSEEVVLFVLLSFFPLLELEEQPKKELRKICFFSLAFAIFLIDDHFYASTFLYTVIFSVQLIYTKLT